MSDMPLAEAIAIAREVEAKEDRSHGIERGRIVHIAMETVIRAAEKQIRTN